MKVVGRSRSAVGVTQADYYSVPGPDEGNGGNKNGMGWGIGGLDGEEEKKQKREG